MTDVFELPAYDEASELFGAPEENEISGRLGDIFGLICGHNDMATAREALIGAAALTAEAQSDAYAEVIRQAFETDWNIPAAEDPHAVLKSFFHVAARYGETRLLANQIETLFTLYEAADAPAANKLN